MEAVGILAFLAIPFGNATAANIVGGNSVGHYNTIQAAINAFHALSGQCGAFALSESEHPTLADNVVGQQWDA